MSDLSLAHDREYPSPTAEFTGSRLALDSLHSMCRPRLRWFARRVNLPQADALDLAPKSKAFSRCPASIRGAFRDRHERWVRDAVDAAALLTNSAWGGRRSRVVPVSPIWSSCRVCRESVPGTSNRKRHWNFLNLLVPFAFRSSWREEPQGCTNFGKRALDAPTLASSSRRWSARDGGKKARSPGRARY